MQRIVLALVCALAFAVADTSALFEPIARSILKNSLPKTGTELQASFIQAGKNSGFHRADLTFNTTIPSLNPDETDGVTNVECFDDDRITLTMNNAESLNEVEAWPDQVLLFLSTKWKCFIDDERVQYFLVDNKTTDAEANKVTFHGKESDISKWSNNFQVSISWEKADQEPTRKLRRRSPRSESLRRRADGDIDINKENKIDLDVLYDEKTGKSSHPDFPIVKLSQGGVTSESIVCADCYVQGDATLSLVVQGEMQPEPSIKEAKLSVDGDIMFNLDIKVNGGLTASVSSPDIQLLEVPLTPLTLPGVFNVGPAIILAASASVSSTVTGTYYTGTVISYPNFHLEASLVGDDPGLDQSGFDPQVTQKPPSVGVTVSGSVAASLKPQLALSVDVLNGLVGTKAGFEFVATLDTTVAHGAESGCPKDQTNIKTSLSGSVGCFLATLSPPSIPVGSVTLGEVCVE